MSIFICYRERKTKIILGTRWYNFLIAQGSTLTLVQTFFSFESSLFPRFPLFPPSLPSFQHLLLLLAPAFPSLRSSVLFPPLLSLFPVPSSSFRSLPSFPATLPPLSSAEEEEAAAEGCAGEDFPPSFLFNPKSWMQGFAGSAGSRERDEGSRE